MAWVYRGNGRVEGHPKFHYNLRVFIATWTHAVYVQYMQVSSESECKDD